jgi:hypothetical protein
MVNGHADIKPINIIFQIKNKKKLIYLKNVKDEVNNVFDTNIFRQVKTGNFISKAHVYLNT